MSTVTLTGANEQTLLISAVRYAFGRATYMPALTCDVLREHMGDLEPVTAAIIARDIRSDWLMCYADSDERGMFYDCDVQPFVDLLPLLDKRIEGCGVDYVPYLPVGYDRWSDVPEDVRWRGYDKRR